MTVIFLEHSALSAEAKSLDEPTDCVLTGLDPCLLSVLFCEHCHGHGLLTVTKTLTNKGVTHMVKTNRLSGIIFSSYSVWVHQLHYTTLDQLLWKSESKLLLL